MTILFKFSILIFGCFFYFGIFSKKSVIRGINSNKTVEIKNNEGLNNTSSKILISNNINYIPKVSVIVYVYNSQQYLTKCLETIINQTLKEIEIICIDDGSGDNSLDILKKYSKKDKRITLIKQKHLNSGIARNIGLKVAKGNYLSFIDSYDYLELNMLEKMYLKITKYNNDIIICKCQVIDIDPGKSFEEKQNNLRLNLIPKKEHFSIREVSGNIFQIFEGWAEDKLFRKDFILNNNIKFQEINNFNDIEFVYTSLCLANSLSVIKENLLLKAVHKKNMNYEWEDPNSFLLAFDKISLNLLKNGLYKKVRESFWKWAINLGIINFHLDEIAKVYLFNTIQKKFTELDYLDESSPSLKEYRFMSYIKYQKNFPTINIAYMVNKISFNYCLVSIASLLQNSENENINIILLYKDISLNHINKIFELKQIRFFTLQTFLVSEKQIKNIQLTKNRNKELLPIYILADKFSSINKILYLDCNTVVKKSLLPLWEININNELIAAVEDISFSTKKAKKINLKDNFYFNHEVFLLNTKEWRKNNLNDKIIDYMKKDNQDFLTYQDILNILTDMKKIRLSPEFNFMGIQISNKNQRSHEYLELYGKKEPFIINYGFIKNINNEESNPFIKEFLKYNALLTKIKDFHLNIPIVLASDDKGAPFMYTTIISALEHKYNNTYYTFFLLVPRNFSESFKNKIMEIMDKYLCNINFIYVNKIFENIKMKIPHITFITYYRLLIGYLLPKEINKCIYLDVDICVCKDLSELYNINLNNNYLAGVVAAGHYFTEKYNCKRLNLTSMKSFVNAGMLLMNLKQIRKDNITQKFINLSKKNYGGQDQDIINVACYGKILTLPPKYNAMVLRLEENNPLLKKIYKEQDIMEAKTAPHIIHYADKKKPWNSCDVYMRKYWWDIFKRTPFINNLIKSENIYKNEIKKWWNKSANNPLNIDNPQTFLEKIQWLKLYDSTPIKTMLTDKYLVREWVIEKIGEEFLTPLLAVYNRFEEIEFGIMPKQFVIKCNHGKGYNIFVKDKNRLNLTNTKSKLEKWMNENYAFKNKEFQYRDIPPKIIIEKYIGYADNDIKNYKFICFNGKPYFFFIDIMKSNYHQRYLYDLSKVQLAFRINSNASGELFSEKSNFSKMVELASILSKDFKYVIVDFYINKNKIYFNGMEFTGETDDILLKRIDKVLASLIKIPKFAYNIDTDRYYNLT